VRRIDHAVHHHVVGVRDVDQLHAGAWHHHVPGAHVRHPDHAFEHLARIGTNDLTALGITQPVDQLVGGIRSGMNELGELLQKCSGVFAVGSRRVRV